MAHKKFDPNNYDDDELRRREHKSRRNTWLYIGVAVAILLLLVWLTIADLWGDTDVAAAIAPLI